MKILSNIKDYTVDIVTGFDEIKALIELEDPFFVVDQKVYNLYFHELFNKIPTKKLYLVDALETNKTIDTALLICEAMLGNPSKRNSRLISFGGGIIQDITGFAANILYRGIRWTFVPTTLLAACDSCIGGKTSLNYKSYKNLLGTFYPPESVLICPSFFNTLDEMDYNSGLGEVFKFNLMTGENGLINIEKDIAALLARDTKLLVGYIETSLAYKKSYIEEDEFDLGIRKHLNFAHTFGHAFETSSNFTIPHGTAVAMGIIMANRVSLSRGLIDKDFVVRSEKMLLQIIKHRNIESLICVDVFVDAIKKDKKQSGDGINAILMNKELQLIIVNDLKIEEIHEGLNILFEHLKG
jgi:3-dehydroquinate synthase